MIISLLMCTTLVQLWLLLSALQKKDALGFMQTVLIIHVLSGEVKEDTFLNTGNLLHDDVYRNHGMLLYVVCCRTRGAIHVATDRNATIFHHATRMISPKGKIRDIIPQWKYPDMQFCNLISFALLLTLYFDEQFHTVSLMMKKCVFYVWNGTNRQLLLLMCKNKSNTHGSLVRGCR